MKDEDLHLVAAGTIVGLICATQYVIWRRIVERRIDALISHRVSNRMLGTVFPQGMLL